MLDLDTAWIISCAGLVFLMQPGFMCLESGMTRSKNNINVAVKNLADISTSILTFWAFGYALMFGTSIIGIVGGTRFFPNLEENPAFAAFFVFQALFCGTATTIVSGAVAERLRFSAYLIIALMISGLIYPIFGHWAWGGYHGGDPGWLAQLGFIDFAGATVVHSTGGWVALAALILIGPRSGKFAANGRPLKFHGSNLPFSVLGAMLLWLGWLGFNAGSTFALDNRIPGIVIHTLMAGTAGMVTATALGWWRWKIPEVDFLINGALAGLVAITASCDAVSTQESVIIGAVGGGLAIFATHFLEAQRIDDGVAAVAIHGINGVWSTLAVALYGDPEVLGTGLNWISQAGVQLLGSGVCFLWAFGSSFILLKLLSRVLPLRVSQTEEDLGLNVSEHKAKTETYELFQVMDRQAATQDFRLRVPEEPFTEVGKIAHRYNQVMGSLEEKANQLVDLNTQLEQAIVERSIEIAERKRAEQEVRLLLNISQVVSTAPDFDSALELVLRQVCQVTDWTYGELWLPEPGQESMVCSSIWYFNETDKTPAEIAVLQAFRQQTEITHCKVGEGLPGRVWESKSFEWIPEFPPVDTPLFLRAMLAKQSGFNGALGVPIINPVTARSMAQGQTTEVLAIMVFLIPDAKSQQQKDERLVQLISAVAAQMGIVVQQKLFEEALQVKNEELETTLLHLKTAQRQLVESEKLAILGQLVAGIAHEINTPLGAIRASCDNTLSALNAFRNQLMLLYQKTSAAQQDAFFALVEQALDNDQKLSSREKRQQKRLLSRQIEEHSVNNARKVADTLTDMGVYQLEPTFMPLLTDTESSGLLSFAYDLVSLQNNSVNIASAVERASKIVFALKSYAHQDASSEKKAINITDGLETVLEIYHNQMKQGIEVIRNYQTVPEINCYPDELVQVWNNLIHNALQSLKNQGTLSIGVTQDNQTLKITITDNGPGIPENIQEKIFQPFFTTKPAGEGSGLGLDIVKKIIDKHNGSIEFQSQPGHTTFTVTLPF